MGRGHNWELQKPGRLSCSGVTGPHLNGMLFQFERRREREWRWEKESGDIAAVEWMRLGEQLSEYGIKRRQHSAVVLKQVCEVYLHC